MLTSSTRFRRNRLDSLMNQEGSPPPGTSPESLSRALCGGVPERDSGDVNGLRLDIGGSGHERVVAMAQRKGYGSKHRRTGFTSSRRYGATVDSVELRGDPNRPTRALLLLVATECDSTTGRANNTDHYQISGSLLRRSLRRIVPFCQLGGPHNIRIQSTRLAPAVVSLAARVLHSGDPDIPLCGTCLWDVLYFVCKLVGRC